MTIKLVGSTNGSTSLDAPASTTAGADLSFTLPNATTGGIVRTTTTPGAILQVVQTVKNDTFSESLSAVTVGSACLATNITPSSTNNKILVEVTVHLSKDSGGGEIHSYLYRGGSVIAGATGDAASNRVRTTSYGRITGTEQMAPSGFSYLDSPSSTSQQTYDVRFSLHEATTVYLNRTCNDTDTTDFARTISTMTLTEIAG